MKAAFELEEAPSRRSERLRQCSLAGSHPAWLDFVLPQQDIRRVAQLTVVLHEYPGQLAYLTRPTAQIRGQQGTVVQMREKPMGQISATARTLGQVRPELAPPIAAVAREAVGNRVIPAVGVKKRALFEGQGARPLTVEMEQANPVSNDRVVRRDDAEALGTGRIHLLDHEHHSERRRGPCPIGHFPGTAPGEPLISRRAGPEPSLRLPLRTT